MKEVIDLEFHFKKTWRKKKMQILKQLEGKRTYIIAGGLLTLGVIDYLLGTRNAIETIKVVLEAAAIFGIRASIANLLKE